jgi:hypothetical protein
VRELSYDLNRPVGCTEHPLWDACRLWSLWDMLEFNAAAFYEVSSIQHTLTVIEARQIKGTTQNPDDSITLSRLRMSSFYERW